MNINTNINHYILVTFLPLCLLINLLHVQHNENFLKSLQHTVNYTSHLLKNKLSLILIILVLIIAFIVF